MPASPTRAEPAPPLTPAERRTFLRYTRTENWPDLVRFPISAAEHESLLAAMLQTGVSELLALRMDLEQERDALAAALEARAGVRSALATISPPADQRIVAIGDSVTADRTGWFELLAALTAPDPGGPAWINLGVSGNTSADLLARYDLLVAARPTRVLLLTGTNDAREHAGGVKMASAPEFGRNLAALLAAIARDLAVPVTLITPPAADQGRIALEFAGQAVSWQADDIAEIARIVRTVDAACVDIHAAMTDFGAAGLLEGDGVHPNGAGQQLIAAMVLARLASGATVRPGYDTRAAQGRTNPRSTAR